ncbi:MAG: phosphodiester glycosidase family protein [Clostridia bacterium]|nr:phosphodiester glycosidase family protein [Clostridia bacterium]
MCVRRLLLSVLLFSLLLTVASCESATPSPSPVPYFLSTGTVYASESPTLRVRIESILLSGSEGFLTTVWMEDPGRQILKASSPFHESLATAQELAAKVSEAAVIINGSGYVSPIYPEIPDNYPGKSPDYYYTPLGSVTVTQGEVLRCLRHVPYYGLTLQQDGLHLHVGDDPEEVTALGPAQTWSFYEGCPMIDHGEIILNYDWTFARRKATRTILSLLPDGSYQILTCPHITVVEAAEFLKEHFAPVWSYDLDGGPSSALFCREDDGPKLLFGAGQPIVDVMAFTELTDDLVYQGPGIQTEEMWDLDMQSDAEDE